MTICSLLLAVVGGFQEDPEPALAIVHVGVVDVAKGELLADRTVVIEGDRITWVGPAGVARPPEGTQVVEGAGKFLVPGLWDMHVHLQRDWTLRSACRCSSRTG